MWQVPSISMTSTWGDQCPMPYAAMPSVGISCLKSTDCFRGRSPSSCLFTSATTVLCSCISLPSTNMKLASAQTLFARFSAVGLPTWKQALSSWWASMILPSSVLGWSVSCSVRFANAKRLSLEVRPAGPTCRGFQRWKRTSQRRNLETHLTSIKHCIS